MKLFYQPEGKLRMELEDKCWVHVKPTWASPLSMPNKYLALLDGRDKEIMMIADPATLDTETREILLEELNKRYLTSQVLKINRAATEFGVTYWNVETDRGQKEFVTQSLQENAQWMGTSQLLIIDVDGNRFEIRDVNALDTKSRDYLSTTV